ncbi:MAG: YHYH protein [Chloroflexota bacterium]
MTTKITYLMTLMFLITGIISMPPQALAQADCDTSHFVDVSEGSAGEDYPAPELSVTCTETEMIITSNGITNFEFVPMTPGDLQVTELTYTIPLDPVFADEPTDIPLLGTVAVAVNGLPIYGPNEGGNLGFGDPFLDGILDFCNGHVGPSGYHFHARPDCLFDTVEDQVGLVIGYALDGYPILAPYVCTDESCEEIVQVSSSWQRTSDVTSAWEAHEYVAGSGDLDQCNGMVDADGNYAYYATDTFPYLLACYQGEVSLDATGEGQPPTGENRTPPDDNRGNGRPPRNP